MAQLNAATVVPDLEPPGVLHATELREPLSACRDIAHHYVKECGAVIRHIGLRGGSFSCI